MAMRIENSTRRRFLRHHAEIPIEISIPDSTRVKQTKSTHDISNGGLSFISETPFPLNKIIKLCIRITRPFFEETAKVVWCEQSGSEHEIGVKFLNNQALYRIRMVEQICHIEQYRKDMAELHGRKLTAQEAALEWISKYAAVYREQH